MSTVTDPHATYIIRMLRHHRVDEALTLLPADADAIADTLHTFGITGERGDLVDGDPIHHYLLATTGTQVHVDWECWHLPGDTTVGGALPPAVTEFLNRFEERSYPHLETS